ncbi:MAG TPA: hemerythrin domain-containing protein [Acidimicrobiia bacterium]|nr:hemerythrin domain-containing protein [Acidimicrobiia bacterium]
MCDYCSCRDHPLIERLGDDHAALLAWAGRVEAALGPADPAWAAAVRRFLADLRAHIHLEEYDVFPAAAQLLTPRAWAEAEASAAR